MVLIFARDGLLAVEVASREKSVALSTRASPIAWRASMRWFRSISGNRVLLSECYELGSVLLEVRPKRCKVILAGSVQPPTAIVPSPLGDPDLVTAGSMAAAAAMNPTVTCGASRGTAAKSRGATIAARGAAVLYADGHLITLDESGLLQLIKVDPKSGCRSSRSIDLDRPAQESPTAGPAILGRTGAQPRIALCPRQRPGALPGTDPRKGVRPQKPNGPKGASHFWGLTPFRGLVLGLKIKRSGCGSMLPAVATHGARAGATAGIDEDPRLRL
jgi:hypothetical protein